MFARGIFYVTQAPGSFGPGDEADIRLKWQQKVFGPQELLIICSGGGPSQRRRGEVEPAAQKGLLFRLEVFRKTPARLVTLFRHQIIFNTTAHAEQMHWR